MELESALQIRRKVPGKLFQNVKFALIFLANLSSRTACFIYRIQGFPKNLQINYLALSFFLAFFNRNFFSFKNNS